MCKKETTSFIVPSQVVQASHGTGRRLAFRKEVNISTDKVRRYESSENPDGFGHSQVLMHGNRALEGSIQIQGNVKDEATLKRLLTTMVGNLDEIKQHDLLPRINFGPFTPPGHNRSAENCYFAFKRNANDIEGHAFTVDGKGNVVLSCTFNASRALVKAQPPQQQLRGSTSQPEFAGVSGS